MNMMKESKKKIPSLSAAVRNYYLIFNTLLLLVFGICMLGISIRLMLDKVKDTSEMITEQAVLSLNNTFNDIASQMVTFSSYRDLLNRLSKSGLQVQERLDLDRELNTILKKTDLFNSVVQDIFVIADNGYVFSTATQTGLSANYDYWGKEWYKEAKDTGGNVYVRMLGLHPQDFYGSSRALTAAKDTFSMSFALKNARGKVIGAMIYNFDLEQIGETLRSSNYEEHGKVALLNEEGVIVSQSDNRQVGETLGLSNEAYEKMKEQEKGILEARIDDQNHLISFQTTSMGFKLLSYVPQSEIWKHTWSMVLLLVLTMVICLLINFLIAFGVTKSIRRPIQRLTRNVQVGDFEHLQLQMEDYQYQELNQIAEKFTELLEKRDTLIQNDYKSSLLLNKFRLYSLQSQINPHFLMNTLQQLQTEIVYGNVEASNEIVVSLSKMLRYSLYNYEEIVPIELEIQYIRSYLNLFTKKYEGELRAEYQIDHEVSGYYMPKMLLQPVVENCIIHAFHENPKGALISIRVEKVEAGFLFSVEDNGNGMGEEQLFQVLKDLDLSEIDDQRIGIRNIHQKIRLMYGEKYGISITSKEGTGTCFMILIPRISRQERMTEGGAYETLDY